MAASSNLSRRVALGACCLPCLPVVAARRAVVPDAAAAITAIVDRSNGYRDYQGRGPLRRNAALEAAAQAFAAHLARVDRLAHDADGRSPAQRATGRGYRWCSIRENIGYAFDSAGFDAARLARTLMDGWIRSPGHRANLLAPRVLDIGVGLARSAKSGRYYAVQMLGRGGADCSRARR